MIVSGKWTCIHMLFITSNNIQVCLTLQSVFQSHSLSHTWLCLQEQLEIQYLAQGHFDTLTAAVEDPLGGPGTFYKISVCFFVGL